MTDEEKKEGKGPAADAAQEGQAGMTEEELRAQLEEQFRHQKVSDLLVQYMVSLSTLAYMKMGITEDTADVRDLEQARLAIDSYKALLESIGERLGKQDFQALSGALASMQMTFVQAAEGDSGGEAKGDAASADDGEKTKEAGVAGEGPEAGVADDSSGLDEGGKDNSGGKQGSDPASRLWVPGKD